uniref:Uncharacterized protein n=1 Tax=Vitrella brassicaformis TaxID=1169539 RepID=A0A7S1K6C3_9ALVE
MLPIGLNAESDGQRIKIALICLAVGKPFLSLVTNTSRFLKDGPSTNTSPFIFVAVIGYLLVPRILQAKMMKLSTKVLFSFLFASLDLLADILLPYGDLICMAIGRWFASQTSQQTLFHPFHRIRAARQPSDQKHGFSDIGIDGLDEDPQAKAVSRNMITLSPADIPPQQLAGRSSSSIISGDQPVRPGLSLESTSSRRSSDGRVMKRDLSLRSTMSSIASDPRSIYVMCDVHPRYLRAISDQIHGFNLSQLTVLILLNLLQLTLEQIIQPSFGRLAERLWFLFGSVDDKSEQPAIAEERGGAKGGPHPRGVALLELPRALLLAVPLDFSIPPSLPGRPAFRQEH